MDYRKIHNTELEISAIGLGTWAFGSDGWWGYQDDRKSRDVLAEAVGRGVNLIDTAPIYGRGHSEEIIGDVLAKHGMRKDVVLATKLGLNWDGKRVFHDLKPKRMREELALSLKRLRTDYIDIYQVHWPDPDTPVEDSAGVMREFFDEGVIKAVGVSNFSVRQMREFMEHCPLHALQPPYNMFRREIEDEVLPFCIEHKIACLVYQPLHAGILTGKFFFDGATIPNDINRKNHPDLKEPLYSLNKEILAKMKDIARKYDKTLTQLVINWTSLQAGVTSVLVGARNYDQVDENIESVGWTIEQKDLDAIYALLDIRKLAGPAIT
ncbi:MAG: aldo/keto reductase [Candidatus Omnitrophica bacterium]|nr:aldo/keto reductase [Candidatus Omnitrophota bacterium]